MTSLMKYAFMRKIVEQILGHFQICQLLGKCVHTSTLCYILHALIHAMYHIAQFNDRGKY